MIKKVLVVDDEPIISEGISKLIPSLNLPLEVTHCLFSSEQALEVCSEEKIDIVITDINMPIINGMELIKYLLALNPDVQIIILTGFGSFEYAKEAMSFGLKYFLEKPVDVTKLTEALIDCIEASDHQTIEKNFWVRRFIDQAVNNHSIQQELPSFFNFPIEMMTFNSEYYSILANFSNEFLAINTYTIGSINNTGYLILYKNTPTFNDFINEIKLKEILKKGLFLSKRLYSTSDIHYFINESSLNWDKEFYFSQPTLINHFSIERPDYHTANKMFDAFKDTLKQAIKNGELEYARTTVNDFFESCKKNFYPVKLLQVRVNDLLNDFFKNHRITKDEIFDDYSLKIILLSSYTEIKFLLLHMIELYREQNINQQNTSMAHQLNQIIETHYDQEQLSLKWIANNLLYLNPEYIGKLYYKETNIKFSQKLLSFRMTKAIEFLNEGYKVYEVANMVGYANSPEYFVKVFKKFTGDTPKKFLKKDKVNQLSSHV